ncbi:hypothetical protein Poly51_01040 [Rubripirellula tenax]|uniref:AsmA-like C-terminal domain-containing protein n=1 Tax=Rubripirellula tenax TaxID=2528015 RepID=A0A5C6FEC9_9BACT|nr:hypothetical protein [Rubripirellula tenax]TWU59831.1 hypothetical protein Poly51_01040 [Rubripirellula tenax]
MTTDDFLLDQNERSLRETTRRRRDGRSRRRQAYVLGAIALVALLVLAAPSIISHSSIGRSVLASTLAGYGLEGSAESIRIGWVTPLQVTGLRIHGSAAGTDVSVAQLDMDMTASSAIADSSFTNLGQISIRGVHVVCSVDEGTSSIEADLKQLLETPSTGDSATTIGTIKIQDITVDVSDRVTGRAWQLANSNAEVDLGTADIQAKFDGVLTEPGGAGGAIGGTMELATTVGAGQSLPWKMNVKTESLPLSIVELVRRRMPELAPSIPRRVGGDATGAISLASAADGVIEAAIRQLQVRNLTAEDSEMLGSSAAQMWKNDLATLDGELTLTAARLYGRRLEATTDFAKATMDGVVSTTFSLVGTDDNPLRWLEAIDGTAGVEVDLAKLDQALPGMLPLRDGAELISGRAIARLESNPGAPTPRGGDVGASIRRSKLTMSSDALRARAGGQNVVIDPIELSATVATQRGQVRAEEFAWRSAFSSAVGQGDLQSGSAHVQIDFGRLTAMLRPIVEISEATLAGTANGKIRWNASADNVWRLEGSGEANSLLVTLPGGQTIRRQAMKGDVEAVGRWGGDSLEELSRAKISMNTNGLVLQADLLQPVKRPDGAVPMPIAIRGNGRLETVSELAAPWLPAEFVDAGGDFQVSAIGDASTVTTRIREVTLTMTQPRISYATQYFSQPSIELDFAGELLLPDGRIVADKLTLAGEAISAAVKGTASGESVDMQIKWRAMLDRLQGSVQTRVTSNDRGGIAPVQSVGFASGPSSSSVASTSYSYRGDCSGEVDLKTTDGWINILASMTGSNLAMLEPAAANVAAGPMPASNRPAEDVVVWAEPNLKVNGKLRYETKSGNIETDEIQLAGDWFATTLVGTVVWNDQVGDVRLKGPARLKMDKVATLLTPMAGIPIQATGIHETPIDIQAVRKPDGEIALDIETNLGWQSAEVAGVVFGSANIPVRMTETTVTVAPSKVAVGNEQGFLNLAGKVNYRPGPMWMQIDRGVVADSIQLTPEMTDRWLKYLAPLAANTARIQGTLSAELDEALIVFDDPNQTRIVGRLNIGSVEMNAGPLAEQLIGGVDQLKSLAGGLMGKTVSASSNRTLITMPPQKVDFAVDRGIVIHERMYFEIDRAQIITSGRVAFDGRMNMIAQLPLDSRWLGRDLQGLVGQTVSLPIDGTISQPRLDSSGVRQVVAQLGVQAVQGNAENYIQKQLNKQIEKIGLDKLFGR